MTKFMINNRIDALKTDINLLFTITNCWIPYLWYSFQTTLMDSKSTSPVEIINSESVISIARQTLYYCVVIAVFLQNEEEISQLVIRTHWFVFHFQFWASKDSSQNTITANRTCGSPTCNKLNQVKYQPRSQGFKQGCVKRDLVSARRFLLSLSPRNQASYTYKPQRRGLTFRLDQVTFCSL